MPVYLYECPECGEFEVSQAVEDAPLSRCECGEPVRKLIAPVAIHAFTPVGAEAEKIERRTYRTNKETAEGLARGTHMPPADRDVCGDLQSRSSIAQFNSMYDHAKRMK